MTSNQTHPASLRPARPDELEHLMAIDDAASALYGPAGIHIALFADHPFVVRERQRWGAAIALGSAFVAEAQGMPVAFATLHQLDGEPYLDQVSVLPEYARMGLGRALVCRGAAWARARGGQRLWLTTYAHVPFNRPFYEGLGFVQVPEEQYGPELRRMLEAQRAVLPDPEQRIAMVADVGTLTASGTLPVRGTRPGS